MELTHPCSVKNDSPDSFVSNHACRVISLLAQHLLVRPAQAYNYGAHHDLFGANVMNAIRNHFEAPRLGSPQLPVNERESHRNGAPIVLPQALMSVAYCGLSRS